MRLFATVVLLSACAGGNQPLAPGPAGGYHVLFIGNSLTSSNDLPGTVAHLAAAVNDTIVVESVNRANFAIIDHVHGLSDAVSVVRRGGWDYVVLQQGPTSQQIGRDTLILASRLLEPDVRAQGGRIAELMAWPAEPDRIVFDGVLQSCLDAARAVDGICFPAGEAWRAAWAADPTLPLYGPDGYHPSPLGTYLAALVVYESITGHDSRELPQVPVVAGQPLEVAGATVLLLQRVSHETVLRIGGRALSISARLGSSQGGSLSSRPSSDGGSSTAKPGSTVATSNSTPPGSRK
jgi:hypothetical protein